MKCHVCGLTNPPEAIKCDCGYNFKTGMVYNPKDGSPTHRLPDENRIKDFDMPFGSMILFMVKWAIAAIPAMIILAIIWAVGAALMTGALTGLTGK